MVARLTPDQKVACSSHVGVRLAFFPPKVQGQQKEWSRVPSQEIWPRAGVLPYPPHGSSALFPLVAKTDLMLTVPPGTRRGLRAGPLESPFPKSAPPARLTSPLPNPATRRVSRREVSPRTPQVSDPSAGSAGRSSQQVWWPWNPRRGLLVLPTTQPPPNPPAPDLGTDGRALRSSDARRCPGRWSPASTQVLGPASGWRARSWERPGLVLPWSGRKSQP